MFRATGLTLPLCLAAATLLTPISLSAQTPPPHVLDVPYLPQTEDLCGGAAAAMVMRYWGARGIDAEAFAPLVDRAARGIRTGALEQALREQDWVAVAESGNAARVREELNRGRPVIALIEVAPRRFHYVVIVSWAAGRVVLHDPARAPGRTLDEPAFDARWKASDRWMLVVLPPAGAKVAPPAPAEPAATPAPASCAASVDRGIALAGAADIAGARASLEAAAAQCPAASAPWRELAGLDVVERHWADAATHAGRAVQLDAADAYAWTVLATAQYMRQRDLEALSAWNRAAQPLVDLVNVTGLTRTRYRVVADALGLPSQTLLTPDRLLTAERRARDIPAIAVARVRYRPLDAGLAQVDAAVVERDAVPASPASWLALGAAAGAERALSATFASPTGGGDAIAVTWRWWEHRPLISASYAAPAPPPLGGVWRVDAVREVQTFGPARVEETRSHAGVALGRWMTSRLRVEAAGGVDRWSGRGRAGAVSASAEMWPLRDRLDLHVTAAGWTGNGTSFGGTGVWANWRSTSATGGQVWLARAAYHRTSRSSPMSIWPGADTGHARGVLLRAHPLLDDGVIDGGIFGRSLSAGGAEWRRWSRPSKLLLQVAPAIFADLARAANGSSTTDTRTHVDVGAGLRLSLAGMGMVRVDLARGLRDGRTVLSVALDAR